MFNTLLNEETDAARRARIYPVIPPDYISLNPPDMPPPPPGTLS